VECQQAEPSEPGETFLEPFPKGRMLFRRLDTSLANAMASMMRRDLSALPLLLAERREHSLWCWATMLRGLKLSLLLAERREHSLWCWATMLRGLKMSCSNAGTMDATFMGVAMECVRRTPDPV